MNSSFSIHKKVNWIVPVATSWDMTFYPSLVKKIRKSDEYFMANFEWKILPLNEEIIENIFFPLYKKEIENRENYVYETDEQRKRLHEKLQEALPYFLFGFYLKSTGEFAGGILYTEKEDHKFSVFLRTFDRALRAEYSSVTSLDYWAEKVFFEEIRAKGAKTISHGTDNYPNTGRIGLPLFKLKVGGKPKVSQKEHDIIELSDAELSQSGKPTIFFTDENEESFFTVSHLFYTETAIDVSVLGELVKVLEWAKIPLELHQK